MVQEPHDQKTRGCAHFDASRIAAGRLRSCRPSLSRAEASKILNEFFEELSDALAQGEPVKLRSFGMFKVRLKRERVGRNPKIGVEAPITPRKVLTFKASPVLGARINGEAIADREE